MIFFNAAYNHITHSKIPIGMRYKTPNGGAIKLIRQKVKGKRRKVKGEWQKDINRAQNLTIKALQGRNIIARGNALGKQRNTTQAMKGRNNFHPPIYNTIKDPQWYAVQGSDPPRRTSYNDDDHCS